MKVSKRDAKSGLIITWEQAAAMVKTAEGRMRLTALLEGMALPSSPTGFELAQLLEGIKLPSPLNLAKLAAAVGPHDKPNEALHGAVRLYLRASVFIKRHRNDSLAELALATNDHDLFWAANARKNVGPQLRLEMDKSNDAARRYLAKRGLKLSRARSVRDNLLDWIKRCETALFVAWTKKQRPNIQDSMTQVEKDRAIERQAREAGWNKSDAELLASFKDKRTIDRDVYLVPQKALDSLIEMKKVRKRSGGVKSQQTAEARKSLEVS